MPYLCVPCAALRGGVPKKDRAGSHEGLCPYCLRQRALLCSTDFDWEEAANTGPSPQPTGNPAMGLTPKGSVYD
jgi:hypothetical protein